MTAADVPWRDRRGQIAGADAKRIEPGVQFQPAFVRLGDGQGQRIVKGDGAWPILPVNHSDHGSSFESYSASQLERTWKMTALR